MSHSHRHLYLFVFLFLLASFLAGCLSGRKAAVVLPEEEAASEDEEELPEDDGLQENETASDENDLEKSEELEDTVRDDAFFYGGSMVRNACLISGEEEAWFAFELPLISPRKLKEEEISVTAVSLSPVMVSVSSDQAKSSDPSGASGPSASNESYEYESEDWEGILYDVPDADSVISLDHVTYGDCYRGWYYYYLHLKARLPQEEPLYYSVDALDVSIDGEAFSYTPESMYFCNTKGYYQRDIPDDSGILVYHDPPEVLMNKLPDDPDSPEVLSLEAMEDCAITDINALDFVSFENMSCKVNGTEVPWPQERLSLNKGDVAEFSYNLSYQDGTDETSLIKASRMVMYEDARGNECIMNEPQGFSIIGFEGDHMIKEYIDEVIF